SGGGARAVIGRTIPRWWTTAAAAVVIITIVGYAWQTADALRDTRRSLAVEQGELAQARRELARTRLQLRPAPPPIPQLAVPIVDVDPQPTRGAAQALASAHVPGGTHQFALVLPLPPNLPAPATLGVIDANG